jgi:hypothetical protein
MLCWFDTHGASSMLTHAPSTSAAKVGVVEDQEDSASHGF